MRKILSLTLLTIIVSIASFAQLPAISGPTSLCLGDTVTLVETAHPGTWSSSNTAVCNIVPPASGVYTCSVYGVSSGSVTITFVADSGFGSASIAFTVNPAPVAGTISGTSTVHIGATDTLNETVSGGIWSSGDTSVAIINPLLGIITGISVGTSVITYTVSGCGGTVATTDTITVTAITTGIINNTDMASLLINVYPDPNAGYFTVNGLIQGQVVTIYSYTGQRIASRIADNGMMDFSIAAYASGMYLVRVQNQDGSVAEQKKMVKIQ